jgi:dihydropyrimidinase
MDLVIRGGTIITSGGRAEADIGVKDEKIAQIGGVVARGRRELDARSKLVFPGGLDMHVHMTPGEVEGESVPFADNFASGSRAAAAGGVTTLGNISYPRLGEGLMAALRRIEAEANQDSICDFAQHLVLNDPNPESVAELPILVENGHTSLKIFMTVGNFGARAREYIRAMEIAGRNGMLTLIHCEDEAVLSYMVDRLLVEGRGHPSNWAASRPPYSEAVSTARAVAFCQASGAPVYIVHLASKSALQVTQQARAAGLPVFVETRPMFLHLTSERLDGPDSLLYIGAPPLGSQDDVNALWAGLSNGDIQTACSDHGPWTRKQKVEPGRTIANMRMGAAEVETNMPLLFSEGVRKNRISLERFVEVTSTNPAKLFGLYPRKGTVSVGSDADLVIWDPEEQRTVRAAVHHSNADFNIYEGWQVVGWPTVTVRRGEIIYGDGKIVESASRGKPIPRHATMAP